MKSYIKWTLDDLISGNFFNDHIILPETKNAEGDIWKLLPENLKKLFLNEVFIFDYWLSMLLDDELDEIDCLFQEKNFIQLEKLLIVDHLLADIINEFQTETHEEHFNPQVYANTTMFASNILEFLRNIPLKSILLLHTPMFVALSGNNTRMINKYKNELEDKNIMLLHHLKYMFNKKNYNLYFFNSFDPKN